MRSLLTVAAAVLWIAAAPVHAASIVAVSPQGEVAQVRQVVVKFSEAVVAFGDPRLPDPVGVTCDGAAPAGSGRWSNDRVWLYDFSADLPPGVRCGVKARADWAPSHGALTGATTFAFGTGGPAITATRPGDGATIDEDQYFILRLSGPAVERTVAANAWCEVEGIGERISVRVIGGDERAALLAARHVTKAEVERTVVLACQRPLPNGATVRVMWGAGIAAATNPKVVTKQLQRYTYTVRDAFSAEFSCERENANAPCLPIRPMTLRFSAPITRELAAKVRLVPAGGAALAPVFDKDDLANELSDLHFPIPLPEKSNFTIELPRELKDDAGRMLANAADFPLHVATGDAPPIAKFAASPFGVIERADPVLPVTLRHVQGDLRSPSAAGAGAGSGSGPGSIPSPSAGVRDKRLVTDAEVLAWYAKLRAYHESELSAKAAGLPEKDWFVTETVAGPKGRTRTIRSERMVATRELALLKTDAGARRLDLPQLAGGDPRPFEVVGIPLPEPGYHVVEIESPRLGQSLLGKSAPMFVRTGVLVTNLGVHFKHGRENSLVWVTTLDRGTPVEAADIVVNDCTGHPLWSGRTDAQGLARVDQALDGGSAHCVDAATFFVSARKADPRPDAAGHAVVDMAFVFGNWNEGFEPWRFNQPTDTGATPTLRAATVFDRTLLRAGETVSMKHFIRRETSGGLAALTPAELPTRMKIIHEGSGQEITQPLTWRGARSANASWTIPPAAKLGVYQVVLERDAAAGERRAQFPSGSFRVEEFRVPLVDARLSGPKETAVAPASVPVALQLNYLSGGPMAKTSASASAVLRSRSIAFDGYDEFSFDPPRDAKQPAAGDDDDADSTPADRDTRVVADKLALTTDANGAANFTLKDLPPIARPSEIGAEVTYNDPNGETQTIATTIPVWPSAVVLGIKTGAWASARGKVAFSALALDTRGQPIPGQQIEVRGRIHQTISTRKRMVGGFYAYDNRNDTRELGVLCSGTTDAHGLLACNATLDTAGEVQLIANAKDATGHAVQAAGSVWVTQQGELWFAQGNDDRIDVLPEKKRYEPGETARLQVRMPFREATALVTVEREGIVQARLVTLRGSDPTIEVPIDKAWAPNVYVSVLALRGRIREVPWYSFFTWGWREPLAWARSFWYDGHEYQAPTAMVDLSKPAFRIGVAALKVGMREHELKVDVSADRPQYAVRQTARARVKVSFEGKPLAGAEVAFAAVDEGLLALAPNDSWDLLNAMIQPRAWSVETATAQGEIIGRRHYGRKAVAAGGGGGHGASRELFDTLLVWKPVVALDANGEATIDVPLNDSLTSFRLVAIADASDAASQMPRFGSGSASIRVTQDLQLLSGLPPLVRDGDRFSAMLTLRNTTAHEMRVHATLAGTARVGDALTRTPLALAPQDVVLAPGAARELAWPVEVPAESASIAWEASAVELTGAAAGGGASAGSSAAGSSSPASDRLKVTQLVAPAVPVRVLQATLAQLDGSFTLPIAAPADALPETGVKRGGLQVGVQPKLTGALPGMRRFFETYPFICLEQKTSKSVGLKDAALWSAVANQLPTYLDSDGLASYFPPRADEAPRGSDRLTAYVLAATNEAGFELPAPARNVMLDGLTAFVEGRIERKFWAPRADLDVRKLAAIEALSRFDRAQPRMLGSINLVPNTWPTAAVIDWLNILKRVPGMPDAARRRDEANQILRARLTYAGTTLKFSTEETDFWWWLMDSADANAARLILAVLDDPAWKDDLPRLVVGSLGRQRNGAWLTTTANLWGSLALDKFAAKFESTPIAGRTRATLGTQDANIDWSRSGAGGAMKLAWPAQPGSLSVVQDGTGKPWLTVQALAAIPLKAPLSAGYRVTRSLSAVERKDPSSWSRGDIVRVHVEIEAQSDMTWVVVSDPVPAGATILGSGLGRDSALATSGEKRRGDAWPAFEERSFEAFRSYYEYLPKGRQVIEYTVRLNNAGTFALPPTRVEAMYAPESFGEAPNASVEVAP